MKMTYFISVLNLLFAVSAGAASAQVGILKCFSSAAKGKAYTHGFYFEKTKKWRGLNFSETMEKPGPAPVEMHAAFDGKIIAGVKVKPGFSALPELPSAVQKTCGWLKENGRQELVLTTNREHFSDPDGWKPGDLNPEELKGLEQAALAYPACKRRPGPIEAATLGHFEIRRAYRAKDGRRLVGLFTTCPEIKEDALAPWDPGVKDPWSLWIFRTGKGKWVLQPNLDLIDIGDFDGDGKTEGVFQAGYDIPNGTYALVDLQKFTNVTIAHDGGY